MFFARKKSVKYFCNPWLSLHLCAILKQKCLRREKMESRKRKIILSIVTVLMLGGIIWGSIFGIIQDIRIRKDSGEYLQAVLENCSVYQNTYTEAMPQTITHDVIRNFFRSGYDHGGKTPKLLYIGYDGCQAVIPALHFDNEFGAIKETASQGGLYFTIAGGQKKGGQNTSTAPGWAAMFTGVWGTENGVTGNTNVLNEKTRSIIYTLGEQGFVSSFSVSWSVHIKLTYKKEIVAAAKNGLPLTYRLNQSDDGTFASMRARIEAGDDAIFGILECTDHTGHQSGFSRSNPAYVHAFLYGEECASALIDTVKSRPTYDREDWLIIITSDHGGYGLSHGGITIMERLTFFSINKDLSSLLPFYQPVKI